MRYHGSYLAVAVLLSLGAQARADEMVTWNNREAIKLTLTVGEERTVIFPDNVQVGLPPEIASEMLRTQSVSGAVYWKAIKPFKSQRVYARLVDSGHIVLFDLAAVEPSKGAVPGTPEPMRVLFPAGTELHPVKPDALVGSHGDPAKAPEPEASEPEAAPPQVSATDLIRYAAQQLYAPQRLLRDMPGVNRVPMKAPTVMNTLYRGQEVLAYPVASWSGGGLFVTAAKLVNQTKTAVTLDPRRLRGDFRYAGFQHASLMLGAKGSETDTTTVYLITERPFSEAVM